MRINLKHCVWIGVLTLGISFAGAMAPVATSASQEVQVAVDYSKDPNYQLGMRDGKSDFAHNKDHSKKRKFKKDDDQKAYEAGYQNSHHK